jgi:LytS/YehU family sensor histidine kinase
MMKQDHELHQIEHQRQLERMSLSLKWAVALAVALVAVIVLLVVVIVQRQRERRLREQSMRNRITSLRMETVRNRITPHFMGNALTAEMLAQMEGREVNLNELVQLLHRGSEMTGTEQTTLDEELEFIEFYCGVEKRTIGPDFEFRQELAPDVAPNKVVLPAMFLQILVENALKHGLKPKPRQAGRKRMVLVKATKCDGGTLVEVLDNGIGLAHEGKFIAHTGLKVVIETMQLLNEQNSRQMGFELHNCDQLTGDTGCCASLFLPDDYRYTIN